MLGGLEKSLRLRGSRHYECLSSRRSSGSITAAFAFVVTGFQVQLDAYHIDSKKFSFGFRFNLLTYIRTLALGSLALSSRSFRKFRNQSIVLPTPQNALLIVQPTVDASLVSFSTSSPPQSSPKT
jgi:hypothetical protein